VSAGLLDEVLEAHGGLERWSEVRRISARVRAGGLLPRTRMPGNRLADVEATVELARPRTVLDPFPGPGRRGVFEGAGSRIETADGEAVESRDDARPLFSGRSGLRRNLRWDALDSVYFAGYALWNYLTTPHLLTRDGVEVVEGESRAEGGERWRRLEVRFPPGLPTHSREQAFLVDGRGLVRRHDYTAEVVGGFAKAAHYCDEHREFGGLVFPTRRRVVPRGPRGGGLRGPVLVSLEIGEVRPSSDP
jgi:hypothetical protein